MLGGGIYPGMITATVGTALLLAVVGTSLVIVRRRLSYEWWYAVHLMAYAGIALAWFHEIPTGNELVLDRLAADYWRGLFIATIVVLVGFRIVAPLVAAFRYRLRVAEVKEELPGVVSLTITGRKLDRLRARAGQFFLWRFLDRHRFWTRPPVLAVRCAGRPVAPHHGQGARRPFARGSPASKPGTRVVAEGPLGVFTEERRRRDKTVLIAGGIGITPIRALLERMHGDAVVLYRVVSDRRPRSSATSSSGWLPTGARRCTIVAGDHRGDGKRAAVAVPPARARPRHRGARRLPLRPARR